MAQTELTVFAHIASGFVPAGLVELTEINNAVEASSFAYGTRYLDRPEAFEVDPVSLSLRDKAPVRGVHLFPVNQLTLFGGIRDAAPDAWGRRVIEAHRKVPANSLPESAYLIEAGSERVGALDVRETRDAAPRTGVGAVHSLQYLLETVERVERGESVPTRLTDLLGSGAGAGGARPKASARDEQGVLWLAKFSSVSDTFDVARAESATLKLARLCGMTVPEAKVLELGTKPCLLIRRFDRYWQNANELLAPGVALYETEPKPGATEHRLPFASGLTMAACDEMESRLKGYDDLAHAIRARAHPDAIRADNRELFARMVFNIMVSNDDDHLRNHGFVLDPVMKGWRLSPLYDVVPRPGNAYQRFLHLKVGQQGKLATLDNAMSGYAAFSLSRPEAVAVIAKICAQVAKWKSVFEEFGVQGRLIDTLAPAFRDILEVASAELYEQIERAAQMAPPRQGR